MKRLMVIFFVIAILMVSSLAYAETPDFQVFVMGDNMADVLARMPSRPLETQARDGGIYFMFPLEPDKVLILGFRNDRLVSLGIFSLAKPIPKASF